MSASEVITVWIIVLTVVLGIMIGQLIHGNRGTETATSSNSSVVANPEDENRLFGFIIAAESREARSHLAIDEARMYIGEAAIEAAIRNGDCTRNNRSECAPNDFYIENKEAELAWYPAPKDAQVVMQTLSHDAAGAYVPNEQISLANFYKVITSPQGAPLWRRIPFWFTVEDGVIVRIEEQYIP